MMDTPDVACVAIEDRDGVRVLRMDRPPVNALGPDMLAALADGVRAAPEDGAKAIVLAGGDRVFTGGLDIGWLLGLDRDGLEDALSRFFDTMLAFAESRVPLAAAVRGHSPAGGAVLAMLCDRRVMSSEGGAIGLNEVRIGIPLPAVVIDLAVRTVGRRRAEALCVEGALLPPPEALAAGLVDELAPSDEVVGRAVEWCHGVAGSPALALERTRRLCREDLVNLVERHRVADVARLAEVWASPAVQRPLAEALARLRAG